MGYVLQFYTINLLIINKLWSQLYPVFPTKKESNSLNESWGFVISWISDSSSLEIAHEWNNKQPNELYSLGCCFYAFALREEKDHRTKWGNPLIFILNSCQMIDHPSAF
jgi:hypothetical protein